MREETILMVRWKSRKMTCQEYLDFSKRVLHTLQPLHPLFKNMCGWGFSASAWYCFDSNLEEFDHVVFGQLKDDELAFINKDKHDKELRYQSYSPIGFSNAYSNTKKEKDGKVSIDISDGKGTGIGYVNIKFPQVDYDEFYDERFCSDLIKNLTRIVDVQYGVVLTRPLRKKVERVANKFWIGWLTYFSDKEVLKHLPRNKDIMQHHPSKGAFFSIDCDDPNNMGDREVGIAQEIKDALEGSGVLEEYYE